MALSKRYCCRFEHKELGLVLYALQLAVEARKAEGKRYDDVLDLKSTLYDLYHERVAVELMVDGELYML